MRANKNGVNKDQKDKVKKDGYNRGTAFVFTVLPIIYFRHTLPKACD